jgi:hypothetical protein
MTTAEGLSKKNVARMLIISLPDHFQVLNQTNRQMKTPGLAVISTARRNLKTPRMRSV